MLDAAAGEEAQRSEQEALLLHGPGPLLQVPPSLLPQLLPLLLLPLSSFCPSSFPPSAPPPLLPLLDLLTLLLLSCRPTRIHSESRVQGGGPVGGPGGGGGQGGGPGGGQGGGPLQSLIAQKMQRAQELLEEMRLQVRDFESITPSPYHTFLLKSFSSSSSQSLIVDLFFS